MSWNDILAFGSKIHTAYKWQYIWVYPTYLHVRNVDIQIYPDKIPKLPTFLRIWSSRNSNVAFFPTSKKTRASRHLKRLDYWWVSSNHPPDCWALRRSQAGKSCLVSSTRIVLPSLKLTVPSLNIPKRKGSRLPNAVNPFPAAIWSDRFREGIFVIGLEGPQWRCMGINGSANKQLAPVGILAIFFAPQTKNPPKHPLNREYYIWSQPKQGPIFSGKSRKVTIPVHQLWSPENGSRLTNPEGVKLMTNRNLKGKSHDGRIIKNIWKNNFRICLVYTPFVFSGDECRMQPVESPKSLAEASRSGGTLTGSKRNS